MRSDPYPVVSRVERIAIIAVTCAFALVLVVWAFLTPAFDAPDEWLHFDAVLQVALGGGWPPPLQMHLLNASVQMHAEAADLVSSARSSVGALLVAHPGTDGALINQMSQHPPTWYFIAAGLLRLLHFQDLQWNDALLAVRLLNAVVFATMPALVWAAVRRLTRSPRAAVVAASVLLLVPQAAYNGATANNDPPVVVLGAVVTWLVCRLLTGDRRVRTLSMLVLAAAAAIAFKATAFPVVPFAAIALVVSVRGRWRWPWAALAVVVPVLLTSWWWVRNLIVYHTLQPAGLPRSAAEQTWPAGTGPDLGGFVNTFWNRVTNSFWGNFGALAYPSSPLVIATLTVVCLAVVLVWGLRRRDRNAWVLVTLPLITLVAGLQNNWTTYVRTTEAAGIQGRYYFVALAALICLSALAWRRFVPLDGRARVSTALVITSAAMAVYGFSVAYQGFYEEKRFTVTVAGLRELAGQVPGGAPVIGTLAVVAAAGLVAAVLLVVRLVTRNPGNVLPDSATGGRSL